MHFAPQGYPWIFGLGITSLILGLVDLRLLSLTVFFLTLFVAYFFRDPERTPPEGRNFIVAPADGKVVTIEQQCQDTRFLQAPTTRVGIFMSPLDVHVNRLAVSGQIEAVQYHPGKFRPAFAEEAVNVNEQNAVTIQDERGRKVALVQIAGILARRIVCQLKSGERAEQGARYGMIILGSRVDVYCPPDVEFKVKIGQRVKAGETILGAYPSPGPDLGPDPEADSITE